MASIPENSKWSEDVERIETTDAVLGGENGKINRVTKQLADRTLFLKEGVEGAAKQAEEAEKKAVEAIDKIAEAEEAVGDSAENAEKARLSMEAANEAKSGALRAQKSAEGAAAQSGGDAKTTAQYATQAQQKASAAESSASAAVLAASQAVSAKNQIHGVREEVLQAASDVASDAASADASASHAANSSASAADSAASSQEAKVASENARDASMSAAGPLYATEAEGRAAVLDGVDFRVQGSGDIAVYVFRRTNSASSALIATIPSSDFVKLTSAQVGITNSMIVKEFQYVPFLPGDSGTDLEIKNGDESVLSVLKDGKLVLNTEEKPISITVPQSPGSNYDFEVRDGEKLLIGLSDSKEPFLLGGQNMPPSDKIPRSGAWVGGDGGLTYADENGEYQVTNEAVYAPIAATNKACFGAVNRRYFGSGKHASIISKEGHMYPDPDKVLVLVPVFGQSLGMGEAGMPLSTVTNDYPSHALKFKGLNVRLNKSGLYGEVSPLDPTRLTNFDPIIAMSSGSNIGETPCETLAQQLAKQLDSVADMPMRVLSFTCAIGGSSYQQLKKGTQMYANLLIAIEGAVRVAAEKGWRLLVPGFVFQHGEANRTTAVATYKANLQEIRQDIDADTKALTGQTADVIMYYSNPCGSDTVASMNSTQAMYEYGKTAVGAVHAFSLYPAMPAGVAQDLNASGDMTHLTPRGYIYIGYKYVQAILHDLKHGPGSFKGLRPKTVSRAGNVIDIVFDVPTKPLQYKTSSFVRAHPTWGLSLKGVSNGVTITGVEIVGDDTVRVTLSAAPSGTSMQICGGHIPRNDSTLAERPRINIADSTAGATHLGDDLCHWAISFNESFN